MRVLHLSAGNLYGGIERLLVTLARGQAACPQMCPSFGLCFEGRLSGELRAAGATVLMLGEARFSRPWSVWQARRRLASMLRLERFDVVVCHACWPHAVFGPVVRAGGTPLVFWAHDAAEGTHWLERLAARVQPDAVVANSRFTQAALPKLFPGVRCDVTYYPVAAPPAMTPAERAQVRRDVRDELCTAPDAAVVVMTSRLEPWKGHGLLLRALSRLRDEPAWVCWIAGGVQRRQEQAYLDQLRSLARASGLAARVKFLGDLSDVPRLLAAADVHCQPNTGPEPFGIAFVEALGAGLPVVTTAIGAATEIVDDSCGRLVPPEDPAALAGILERLVGDESLRDALGRAGRQRAEALCDAATQLRALRDCFAAVRGQEVAA